MDDPLAVRVRDRSATAMTCGSSASRSLERRASASITSSSERPATSFIA